MDAPSAIEVSAPRITTDLQRELATHSNLVGSFTQSKDGLIMLSLACWLGFMGKWLLVGTPWGLGATVWSLAFVVSLLGFTTGWSFNIPRDNWWISIPMMLIPFGYLWHAATLLTVCNTAALLTLCAVWVTRVVNGDEESSRRIPFIRMMSRLAILFPFYCARQVEWRQIATTERSSAIMSAARGFVIALPFLFFFTLLLSAADGRFADLMAVPFEIKYPQLSENIFFVVFFSTGAGLFLFGASPAMRSRLLVSPSRFRLRPNIIEASAVLGMVSLLFLVFVVVQASHLFDGFTAAAGVPGRSLSYSARAGFFEMSIVAAVSLVLVTSLRNRLDAKSDKDSALFGKLAALNGFLVLLILFSAALRMYAYVAEYGWTELRLNTAFAMVWTSLVFSYLILSLLRPALTIPLPKVGIVAAYTLLGVLNVMNPHAFIAKDNLQGANVDPYYLGRLSEDAVPVVVGHWDDLDLEQKQMIRQGWIRQDLHPSSGQDWRAWSLGRHVGASALKEVGDATEATTLSPQTLMRE